MLTNVDNDSNFGDKNISNNMSDDCDTSDDARQPQQDVNTDKICRDFLRNVCRRGKRCKYDHPSGTVTASSGADDVMVKFCHDFQNVGGCQRPNCRFVHCCRAEEDHYKQTGQLPLHILQQQAQTTGAKCGEKPICMDFLNGECNRVNKCKYRHMTVQQYEAAFSAADAPQTASSSSGGFQPAFQAQADSSTTSAFFPEDGYDDVYASKRRRTVYDDFHLPAQVHGVQPIGYRLLEEENATLRDKVARLKRQVFNLAATNELLLDQNAQFRVSGCSGVDRQPTMVSVNQMLTPTIVPACAIARSAGAMPTMITTLAQPVSMTACATELIVQPARLVQEVVMSQASMAQGSLVIPQVQASIAQGTLVAMTQASMAQANLVAIPQASMAPGSLVAVPQASMAAANLMAMPQASIAPGSLIALPQASIAAANLVALPQVTMATTINTPLTMKPSQQQTTTLLPISITLDHSITAHQHPINVVSLAQVAAAQHQHPNFAHTYALAPHSRECMISGSTSELLSFPIVSNSVSHNNLLANGWANN